MLARGGKLFILAKYKLSNRVAEGTYGVVFRAEDKKIAGKMEKEREGFPIASLREIVTLWKVSFCFFYFM